MHRLYILLLVAVIASGMALTQHYALQNYWYWEYWWLDTLMHFTGGCMLVLALFALGLRRLALIVATMGVGVAWEVYEYVLGISIAEPNFIVDTATDLSMDLLGALLVYGIIEWWTKKSVSPLPAAPDASPDQTSSSP